MAKEGSPESVSERVMFAADAAPFALPPAAPRPDRHSADTPHQAAADAKTDATAAATRVQRAPMLSLRDVRASIRLSGRTVLPSRGAAARSIRRSVALELDRGTAFNLIPVLMAAGALSYFSFTHEPGFAELGAVALALALCAMAARTRPSMQMAIGAILLCVTGALLAKAETWRASTKMLGGEVTTRLSGRVVEVERTANGRVRLTIDVTGTERPTLRYAPDQVRVSARRVPDGLTAGAPVTGLVRLMPPPGPVRPGSYDFSFESYFDGSGASGFFLRGPDLAAETGPTPWRAAFGAGVERLRYAIAERISSTIGGPEGAIAAALVVGVRAGIPDDVNEALRRAGIYHIISISGLHMALVAGTIMGMLRVGFAFFPDFSSRRPVKKYAAAIALVGLASYLFISGAEVAARRSFLMLAVMLVAVFFDRAALTMRNLAIAAVIVIAISPHEVVGPSFQMSFAATAALVGAYAAWSDRRAGRPPGQPAVGWSLPRRLFRKVVVALAGIAVTAVVAGSATAIYAAWHFQQMQSLGVFTNLIAMPVVSTVVMPFAVLGALAMPFGLDAPFFHIMGQGLSLTVAIAQWFSERSPNDMVGLVPTVAVAVLTVALIVATVLTTWLRVASVPIAAAGLILLFSGQPPSVLVSEDGRLVGLDVGGAIAVNRSRPNDFAIENWKRAFGVGEVFRPEAGQAGADNRPSARFTCADGLCAAQSPSGAIVAHARDARAALDACTFASVVIVEDATTGNVCRQKNVLLVTGRDLARNGSVAIAFSGAAVASVEYAISQPYRPWHEHRRFSRAARGLPPYQRSAPPVREVTGMAPPSQSKSGDPPGSSAEDEEVAQ